MASTRYSIPKGQWTRVFSGATTGTITSLRVNGSDLSYCVVPTGKTAPNNSDEPTAKPFPISTTKPDSLVFSESSPSDIYLYYSGDFDSAAVVID